MKNQLRRPNITAIALYALGLINVVLAMSLSAPAEFNDGLRTWLSTPHGALFAIGLLMVLAAVLWTVLDVRHDRRLMARWEHAAAQRPQDGRGPHR